LAFHGSAVPLGSDRLKLDGGTENDKLSELDRIGPELLT
jgi:hypothetical protein